MFYEAGSTGLVRGPFTLHNYEKKKKISFGHILSAKVTLIV